MKRLVKPIHAIFPFLALIIPCVMSVRADVSLKPLFIGVLMLIFVQWLFNMATIPHISKINKDIENKTAEQLNDPGFAAVVTHSTQRGVTFLPTRDIRASDVHRTIFSSWTIVGFVSLATVINIEDYVNVIGPVRLSPYKPMLIGLLLIFFLECIISSILRNRKK